MVIFFSDDHGCWDSEVYGAKDVRTPNMLRVAVFNAPRLLDKDRK